MIISFSLKSEAKKNGVVVHWAKDGKEHNEIIGEILRKQQCKKGGEK